MESPCLHRTAPHRTGRAVVRQGQLFSSAALLSARAKQEKILRSWFEVTRSTPRTAAFAQGKQSRWYASTPWRNRRSDSSTSQHGNFKKCACVGFISSYYWREDTGGKKDELKHFVQLDVFLYIIYGLTTSTFWRLQSVPTSLSSFLAENLLLCISITNPQPCRVPSTHPVVSIFEA